MAAARDNKPTPRDDATDPAADAAELSRLVDRAAAGEADAWQELVERYSHRVFALLMSQCRDADLAEELTQAAFVKVVQKLGDYQDRGKFEPWLFRVAMNSLRDEMRRRKRQATPMSEAPGDAEQGQSETVFESDSVAADSPFGGRGSAGQNTLGEQPLERLDRAEQVTLLRRAITTLSEADQQILQMRHGAGMSFPDIAQALEQPLGTVLARGHRVLKKLRKLMEQHQ